MADPRARGAECWKVGVPGKEFMASAVTTNKNDPLNSFLKTLAGRSDKSDAALADLLKRLEMLENAQKAKP